MFQQNNSTAGAVALHGKEINLPFNFFVYVSKLTAPSLDAVYMNGKVLSAPLVDAWPRLKERSPQLRHAYHPPGMTPSQVCELL